MQSFICTVSHPGLNKYQVVKGKTPFEAEQKAHALYQRWEAEWAKQCEQARAKESTRSAEQIQEELDHILLNSLEIKPFSFESLKDYTPFQIQPPSVPAERTYPREPQRTDDIFNPKPQFFTRISKSKKQAFDLENQTAFENAHEAWAKQVQAFQAADAQAMQAYEKALSNWQQKKAEYDSEQEKANKGVDIFSKNVSSHQKQALEQFFSLLLGRAPKPFEYDATYEFEYQIDSKMLIIEMTLPSIENIPKVKSVSYIKSRQEIKSSEYSEAYLKKKYESVIYQLVLRTLNLCFNSPDAGDALNSIALNGRVYTIDKATGNEINPCILSLTVQKTDFSQLNLAAIDPKAWFKSSKGVSAASLANIAPVAPLIEVSKDDKRFIEAHEVAESLEESTNLAAMDWQDFEHLIRELFEKEFSQNGGEVKITQASRDGGVDAVAFDPDPIRGGKIVIQAKRYTNVVGVSAVRDLYGTVMNEGATKGILVTTSNYGNDAYQFANGKPLTLLNGANLLFLLEKHGYNARIDLKEAKKALTEK